jgi:hypothetical protein
MALVRTLVHVPLRGRSAHTDVSCTYDVITTDDGAKHLQLDTYGSNSRQLKGKKSQSIRFTPEALALLKRIINDNGL